MKVIGIIAEYDPFHKGHAYLAERAKSFGADCVIAVMSGGITQRGEFATFDKSARVSAALECGIDLCVELPVPWACASATDFARGGVAILKELGVTALAFGSESGDAEALRQGAEAIASVSGDVVKNGTRQGITYAEALSAAVPTEVAKLLENPNDLLGMEYIKAAREFGADLEFVAVKRIGAAHGDDEAAGGFASASLIRELARRGEDYSAFIPEGADYAAAPIADAEVADRTLLHLLRGMTAEEISEIDGVSEGLENRIVKAAAEASAFSQVAGMVKSKRYTLARIRRLLMRALIGIRRGEIPPFPPYIRLLGLNERGAARLKAVKKQFPILTKPADSDKLTAEGRKVFELELRAAELRALALPSAPSGIEMRFTPVVKQNYRV